MCLTGLQACSDSKSARLLAAKERYFFLVLTAGFPVRGPVVGLFTGQEINLIQGPLFVNHPYRSERVVVARS